MFPRLTPTRALLLLCWALGLWMAYTASRPLIPAPLVRPAGNTDERDRLSANRDLVFGRVNDLGQPVGRYPNLHYGLVRARFTPEYGEELLYWEEQEHPLRGPVLRELVNALDAEGVTAALAWLEATVEAPEQNTPRILAYLFFRGGYLEMNWEPLTALSSFQAKPETNTAAYFSGMAARDPGAAFEALARQPQEPNFRGNFNWTIMEAGFQFQPRALYKYIGTLLERGQLPPELGFNYLALHSGSGRLDLSLSQINPYWLEMDELRLRLRAGGVDAWYRWSTPPPADTPVVGERDRADWEWALDVGWFGWLQENPGDALSVWNTRPDVTLSEVQRIALAEALEAWAAYEPEAYATWERGLDNRPSHDVLHTLRLLRLTPRDWVQAHELLRQVVDPQSQTQAACLWVLTALDQPTTDPVRLGQTIFGSSLINPDLKSDLLGYLQVPPRSRPAAQRFLQHWMHGSGDANSEPRSVP